MVRNTEFLEKWANALESGEFKQGEARLLEIDTGSPEMVPDRYCCLGVACELDPNVLRGVLHPRGSYRVRQQGVEEGKSYPPGHCYRNWGLSYNEMKGLADLNDHGETFETIAQVIRRIAQEPETLTLQGIKQIAQEVKAG